MLKDGEAEFGVEGKIGAGSGLVGGGSCGEVGREKGY